MGNSDNGRNVHCQGVENSSIGDPPAAAIITRMKESNGMDPISREAVGQRLAEICKALDIAPMHFADSIGLDRSSFSKILKGKKALLPPEAWKIYLKYGFDLNYIYGGNVQGLPPNLSRKLTAQRNGAKL